MSFHFRCTLLFWMSMLVILFNADMAAAAVTFGDIFQNIGNNAKQIGSAIKYVSFGVGGVMCSTGVKGMYDAQKSNGQIKISDGVAKLAAGIALLSLGTAIQSGAVTIFGSEASGVGELGLE
jgi:hypothetical protein